MDVLRCFGLFTLLAVALSQDITSSTASDDTCNTISTDKCGAKLYDFYIDPKEFPTTQEELDSKCKSLQEGSDCAESFLERCPKVVRKDVADQFRQSTRLAVEDVCKAGGPLLGAKLVTHGKCLKEKVHVDYKCSSDFVEQCEAAAIVEPTSNRMQMACCAFLTFDRCFYNHTLSACGIAAARPARAIMQGFAIFMVEKCLPYFAQPEKCNLATLKGLLPSDTRKVTSMLPGLVDVMAATFT